jgi:hypothetical protein
VQQKIVSAVKRMQQLRQIVTRLAVISFFKKLAVGVDELNQAGAGVIEDIAAAKVPLDDRRRATGSDNSHESPGWLGLVERAWIQRLFISSMSAPMWLAHRCNEQKMVKKIHEQP